MRQQLWKFLNDINILKFIWYLFDMIYCHIRGRRYMSRTSLLISVGSVAYMLSPIDIIPDWIPGFGQLDDTALLLCAWRSLNDELKLFTTWRARNP